MVSDTVRKRIGFAFHPSFLSHETGAGHPESPLRLQAICDHLRATGLWGKLSHLDPVPAPLETVALVHPRAYLERLERACRGGPTALDPDTVATPGSWNAALRAVGSVTQAVDRLANSALDAVFCAVRPPGHHATPERAMGFCLLNNVAVGARYAQRHYKLERILIVDWDVHHGNGTQAIFDGDPTILYFSTHQYPFYPGTGARDETGHGPGAGLTVNVPLPAGAGDPELARAFREELLPKALAFAPQLVLVSAGFDAHRDDPLAGLAVTEAGYAELTRIVRRIAETSCKGRIVSVLEGGYNLLALGRSVAAHLRVLMESP